MEHKPSPKIYGLIGFPVEHSLSPFMQGAAFSLLKINAEYKLFPLQENQVGDFLKHLGDNNIFGLNVTVPYKEKVIPFLSGLSEEARLIQAVNTIKRENDKLIGFNTDGAGFLRHLKDLGFEPKARRAVILGSGGAARAISVALSLSGAKAVCVYDVDISRSTRLAAHLKDNFKNLEILHASSLADLPLARADLLVNATPIGMKDSDPLPIDPEFILKKTLVYDLIYNPKETHLLRAARERGLKVSNGLGMLLYQGAASFKIWTGKEAPVETMRSQLLKNL